MSKIKLTAAATMQHSRKLGLLLLLREHGGYMTYDTMAKAVHFPKTSLSRRLSNLIIEKLVERQRSDHDARKNSYELLPAGHAMIEKLEGKS